MVTRMFAFAFDPQITWPAGLQNEVAVVEGVFFLEAVSQTADKYGWKGGPVFVERIRNVCTWCDFACKK